MAQIKLTSILNMIGDFGTIRPTVRALCAQTARENLELIIVSPRDQAKTIDREELRPLAAHQIIEVDSLSSGAYGWSQGIRQAQGPIVVMSEDHGFPASNWAQTLIDAHAQDDYFAVCPAIANGNPRTRTSWANFILSFVEWYAPDEPKLVISGAGHNTSYRRDALLAEYGSDLEKFLNPERMMHIDAVSRGRKILLDSRTSVSHVNLSLLGPYLAMSYAGGRLFGASRGENWGLARKLFYAILFPLVPFIRLKRLLHYFNTPQKRREARLLNTLPLIMLGLYCHACGEAVGYLMGSGNILPTYTNFELRRLKFIDEADRKQIWGDRGEEFMEPQMNTDKHR